MTCFPSMTWEYVGEHMTLPRLYVMHDYWERFPPVHIMVAGLAGHKPPVKMRPIVEEPEFEE